MRLEIYLAEVENKELDLMELLLSCVPSCLAQLAFKKKQEKTTSFFQERTKGDSVFFSTS